MLDSDFKIAKRITSPKPLRGAKIRCCAVAADGRLFLADHLSDKVCRDNKNDAHLHTDALIIRMRTYTNNIHAYT